MILNFYSTKRKIKQNKKKHSYSYLCHKEQMENDEFIATYSHLSLCVILGSQVVEVFTCLTEGPGSFPTWTQCVKPILGVSCPRRFIQKPRKQIGQRKWHTEEKTFRSKAQMAWLPVVLIIQTEDNQMLKEFFRKGQKIWNLSWETPEWKVHHRHTSPAVCPPAMKENSSGSKTLRLIWLSKSRWQMSFFSQTYAICKWNVNDKWQKWKEFICCLC